MNRLKEHYDIIAVAVLIALLALAPAAPDSLDPALQFVHYDQPTVVIVHE
ncbi:MAG: hypothetical protein ABJF23_08800 [Bryobacteraceae bacterium]